MADTNKLGAPVAPAQRFETRDADQLAELLAPFSSDAELRVRGTNGGFRADGVAFRTPRIGVYRLGVSCAQAFAPPPGVVSVTVPLGGFGGRRQSVRTDGGCDVLPENWRI